MLQRWTHECQTNFVSITIITIVPVVAVVFLVFIVLVHVVVFILVAVFTRPDCGCYVTTAPMTPTPTIPAQ